MVGQNLWSFSKISSCPKIFLESPPDSEMNLKIRCPDQWKTWSEHSFATAPDTLRVWKAKRKIRKEIIEQRHGRNFTYVLEAPNLILPKTNDQNPNMCHFRKENQWLMNTNHLYVSIYILFFWVHDSWFIDSHRLLISCHSLTFPPVVDSVLHVLRQPESFGKDGELTQLLSSAKATKSLSNLGKKLDRPLDL